MDVKKTKKRMLLCVAFWAIFLLATIFVPTGSRLIWATIVSICFALLFCSNLWELKGHDSFQVVVSKQKKQKEPHSSNDESTFNYQHLIQLASIVSNKDESVLHEVSDSIFEYDHYVACYYLDEPLTNEEFWERWYPNTKADPNYFYDFLDNKPLFCCMNMLEWLQDKGYTISLDEDYDIYLKDIQNLLNKKGIPLQIDKFNILKNMNAEIENLTLINKELLRYKYCFVKFSRSGDDYVISVVTESEYQAILRLNIHFPYNAVFIEALE